MESPNRRLIRPPLAEAKERVSSGTRTTAAQQKKQTPPDTTNAENFYYVKQMQAKTPVVVVLLDGEELHGTIEWYDKSCIKMTREEGPNLLVYKSYIKYIYKA
ncbi:MAG: RNA chaperone Hfq [Acidobacteria bacterium]|nr:RNA chaperone Hfq [Acidobacteriota bacterium]